MSLIGAGVQRIGTHKRIIANTTYPLVAGNVLCVYDGVLVWSGTPPNTITLGGSFATNVVNVVDTGKNRISLPGPYFGSLGAAFQITVVGGSGIWEFEFFLTTQPG